MSNTQFTWSNIENHFIQKSGCQPFYASENIPTIQVQNVYDLGKIVTLRFLEWISENPNGVIALPTGKTPEYFIKTLEKYFNNWYSDDIQKELKDADFQYASKKPSTEDLKFVMLDEFFPILPNHKNSFVNYVNNYYIKLLNIKKENFLNFNLFEQNIITHEEYELFLNNEVDLTLLDRDAINEVEEKQKNILEKIQNFCHAYEEKIESWGGIGFFLGGIGPDGHIAFNQEGSPHSSKTRLIRFNYMSAAAAAGDLGGIEKALKISAMTIGLDTIRRKKDAVIIIMAAGEGKASVIQDVLENETSERTPGSAFHGHEGARFYITNGASINLKERKEEKVLNIKEEDIKSFYDLYLSSSIETRYILNPSTAFTLLESIFHDASLALKISLKQLTLKILSSYIKLPQWLLNDQKFFIKLINLMIMRLDEKITGGLNEFIRVKGETIVHTGPHHDDIMLAYHSGMHYLFGTMEYKEEVHVNNNAKQIEYLSEDYTVDESQENKLISTLNFRDNYIKKYENSIDLVSNNEINYEDYHHLLSDDKLGETYNNNNNHFVYLTSGFHSVNDQFMSSKVFAALGDWKSNNPSQLSSLSNTQQETIDKELSKFEAITSNNSNIPSLTQNSFTYIAYAYGYLNMSNDDLMTIFRHAFYRKNEEQEEFVENIIFLRNIIEIFNIKDNFINNLYKSLIWIIDNYLNSHSSGDNVPKLIQLLKGSMRENEVERVWCLNKTLMKNVYHFRSSFYTDDFFTPIPSIVDDSIPFSSYIYQAKPKYVSVAFDPEGTGPDTHYKVLQVVCEGLRILLKCNEYKANLLMDYKSIEEITNKNLLLLNNFQTNEVDEATLASATSETIETLKKSVNYMKEENLLNIKVWGYRNVWYNFNPSFSTIFIPVTLKHINLMHKVFLSSFTTQKNASFPSPYFNGAFSLIAKKFQILQLEKLKVLLGNDYFENHPNNLVRNAEGFIFIKSMMLDTFLSQVAELKKSFEN